MEVISGLPTTQTKATRYAGFWNRFGAIIIDALILGAVRGLLFRPMFGLPMVDINDSDPDEGFRTTMITGAAAGVHIVTIVTGWLYFAVMESSNKQATVGKIALNLRVTDLAGNRISFARASGRYFGKYLSAMILMIGFLMAAITQKKQALHDVLAETLVLKNQ
jgi:uncharacterized RDD family membrane protein YckC